MKTIQHITTQICVKAWRSKTFELALEDCDSDEVERIFKSIEESKMFDGWEYYSKNANEFIVIDGKMFWIFLTDEGLEILHKYDPTDVSVISSDPVYFISQRVAFLEGPSNGKGNLLGFANNNKTRNHFAGKAFMASRKVATELGFKISSLVCKVD